MRLPQKVTFIKGKSRCDTCKHELKWFELIPLLSYFLQGGRCRYCKCKIPVIIPICEIIGGLLFGFSYYRFGFSYDYLIAITIANLFIVVLVTDITYYIIPDEVIVTFSLVLILLQFLKGGVISVGYHILTGIFLFLLMYLTMILGEKAFKKESLGGGDVKLLFVFGLVLEPMVGMVTIFLASIIALPISLIVLLKSKNNMIPFGPFLLLAFILLFYSGINTNYLINLLT